MFEKTFSPMSSSGILRNLKSGVGKKELNMVDVLEEALRIRTKICFRIFCKL